MFFTAAFQGQALVYPMLGCHRSRHFAGRAFRWHRGVNCRNFRRRTGSSWQGMRSRSGAYRYLCLDGSIALGSLLAYQRSWTPAIRSTLSYSRASAVNDLDRVPVYGHRVGRALPCQSALEPDPPRNFWAGVPPWPACARRQPPRWPRSGGDARDIYVLSLKSRAYALRLTCFVSDLAP